MTTTACEVMSAVLDDDASMRAFCAAPRPPASSGAVVTFVGVVRDHDGGRAVRELEYEAHPTAAEVLRDTAVEVAAQHPGVATVRVAHRVGLLPIGGTAFHVEVSAAHRGVAFAACSALVDRVKEVLPVWKRQVFADGTEEWVNSP